jgi:hypothetical protein
MNPRLLRPLARFQAPQPEFSPASIEGLLLWLDADDAATVAQNSDGSGSVADDDPVGYWGDKSGNGIHATQTTNNNRPAAKASLWNGRQALLFDGSNDVLETAVSIDAETTRDLTMCIVADVSAGNGNFLALKRDNGDDYLTGLALDYGLYGGSALAITFASGAGSTVADYADRWVEFSDESTRFVAVWRLSGTAGTLEISINGVDVTGDIISGSGSLAASDFLSTGSGLHRAFIGARGWQPDNSPTRWHGGHIAEVVIYDSAISASNLTEIESHLMSKWGIT